MVFNALSAVAFKSYQMAMDKTTVDSTEAETRSEQLKVIIRNYFERNELDQSIKIEDVTEVDVQKKMSISRFFLFFSILTFTQCHENVPDQQIISNIHFMMSKYPENNFTGRTLARIFHGVPSPVYPAQIWSRCKHWRALMHIDFNRIISLANAEILKWRT